MLDPFTTLFTTGLTTAACGLLLLVCCGRGGNAPLLTWAVAMIFAAAGFVVTAAAGGRAGVFDTLGVAILIFGSALFWTATRRFRDARPQWLAAAAGPVAWLGTVAWQTQSPLWTAASCAIGASYTAASVRELLLVRHERLPSLLPAIALTLAHAAVYLCRTFLAIGEAFAPDRIAAPAWIGVALLVEAMIHVNGSTVVLVALSREQQERRASSDLRVAAYQDSLTGIANRRRFDERLDELIGDHRQRHSRLGLIMIDLDRFKSVNDTIGHGGGDRILRLVASIISSCIRPDTDLAARYGGEEFAVIVTGSTLESLWGTAERIRATVETAAIPHPGTGGVITVSMGIGVINTAELDGRRHEFLSKTDQSLYEAKQLGRNRVAAAAPFSTLGIVVSPEPMQAA